MKRNKILIVDDENDVISALQFRLASTGYETLTAANGAEALEILRNNEIDLVLADFMMPEVNGLELTRLVKENPVWYSHYSDEYFDLLEKFMPTDFASDPAVVRNAWKSGAVPAVVPEPFSGNVTQQALRSSVPARLPQLRPARAARHVLRNVVWQRCRC